MAAAYFDPTLAEDLELLPPSVRKDPDVLALAALAEAEVLAAYTVRLPGSAGIPDAYALGDGAYVCLVGYIPDAALAPAGLRAALRLEIAGMTRHLAATWKTNPALASEGASDGTKAVSYRDDRNRRRPEGFGRFVLPYDVRPPALVA